MSYKINLEIYFGKRLDLDYFKTSAFDILLQK